MPNTEKPEQPLLEVTEDDTWHEQIHSTMNPDFFASIATIENHLLTNVPVGTMDCVDMSEAESHLGAFQKSILDSLASKVGVSPYFLTSAFAAEASSLTEYLKQQRADLTARMASTHNSLIENFVHPLMMKTMVCFEIQVAKIESDRILKRLQLKAFNKRKKQRRALCGRRRK